MVLPHQELIEVIQQIFSLAIPTMYRICSCPRAIVLRWSQLQQAIKISTTEHEGEFLFDQTCTPFLSRNLTMPICDPVRAELLITRTGREPSDYGKL